MFTAEDAQAKVIEVREAEEIKKKEEEEAKQKELEEIYKLAEKRVDKSLARALNIIEEAAGKPLSTVRFEVGHRFGKEDLCSEKLTELVMSKLSDLGFAVEDTSSTTKEQTDTVHYQANVWRYAITISW